MRIRFAILSLLLSGLLCAQNEPLVTKIVRVRGDADRLHNLACNGFRGYCTANNDLGAIVLKGSQHDVALTEQTIRDLDATSPASAHAAGQNLELTIYVLGGAYKAFAGAQEADGQALAPVVKQLKAAFPYSHYQLLGTMLMRSALNEKAENTGAIGIKLDPDLSRPSIYQISYASASLVADRNAFLHLKGFRINFRVPVVYGSLGAGGKVNYATTQYQNADMGIETDVDLREGQKVVVGKTNISDSDSCIFLVLSAKLVP